ncbi:MAG: septum formation initiator family protein [Treponema sp.]|jgi:cell division protein FtsB|nr:septum formation initiator family protein [Treponema sp.]
MRAIKYLIALWTGVCIYSVISIHSGAAGLSAYAQLEAEREKEKANIETLMVINKNLENTRDALLYDRDTLTVYAREQGFASEDERFIRIVGVGNRPKEPVSPGRIVTAVPPEHTPYRYIRIFSFCAALTVLICMAAYDFLRYIKEK